MYGNRKSIEASVHTCYIKEWDKTYILTSYGDVKACNVCTDKEHLSLSESLLITMAIMGRNLPFCGDSGSLICDCAEGMICLQDFPVRRNAKSVWWSICPSLKTLPLLWVLVNALAWSVWGIVLVLQFKDIINGSWNCNIFPTYFVSFPQGLHFHLLSCRK